MKVRGAVLREMGLPAPYAESRPLEIAELELDPPGPGELLIRVGAAGLCHSDLSVIDGSRPRVMPMVLGHEAAGEVVETGPGTEGFVTGDLERARLGVGRRQAHLAQDGAADGQAVASDEAGTSRSSAPRSRSGISTGRRFSRSTKTCTKCPVATGSGSPARATASS